jgi:hypothetical protein
MKFNQIFSLLITFLLLNACNTIEKNEKPATPEKVEVISPTNVNQGKINGTFNGCGFDKKNETGSVTISLPGNRELNQINAILKFSGLSTNFVIYSASIQNAMATIIDGKRYILYDPSLLRYTDITSGSYWSSMSILAHEIGHHLAGHTLSPSGSSLSDELEADKYSGFVLYKLGASLTQASAAMQTLASETDSKTHPAKYKRLQAIAQGWNEANSQKFNSAIPPPPADDVSYNISCRTDPFDPEILLPGDYGISTNGFAEAVDNENEIMEGIIINSELVKHGLGFYDFPQQDDSGDGENMVLTIELTKVSGFKQGKVVFKPGVRTQFYLYQTAFITRAFKSCFDELIVPGRKIRFKSYDFNRGEQIITFLQKLNRDGSQVINDLSIGNQQSNSQASSTNFTVSVDRAYFHNTPNQADRRNGYLVYGEQGTIVSQSGQFVYIDFINPKGRRSKGWLLLSDVEIK